jgi:hypothetical protein
MPLITNDVLANIMQMIGYIVYNLTVQLFLRPKEEIPRHDYLQCLPLHRMYRMMYLESGIAS